MRAPSYAFSLALALMGLAPAVDAQQAQGASALPRSPMPSQAAPQSESCIAGRVFGITEYKCTSCGLASPRDSAHVVYSFGSEPVVVETADQTNRIKPGDYVVAVNGNPITTRVGADQFAYPPQGNATITVRRSNVNINIEQLIQSARICPGYVRFSGSVVPYDSMQRVSGGAMAAGARNGGDSARGGVRSAMVGGRGVDILRATPAEVIMPVVQIRNFGLTLACRPSVCTRARTRDGTTMYMRFDGWPAITNPSPTSVAGKAGLRHDDLVISVNGLSPQTEEGALILNRADRELTLRLEISRAGKREKITLKL